MGTKPIPVVGWKRENCWSAQAAVLAIDIALGHVAAAWRAKGCCLGADAAAVFCSRIPAWILMLIAQVGGQVCHVLGPITHRLRVWPCIHACDSDTKGAV